MEKSNIEILFSSDYDYEKLAVEIYIDDKFVALLNQDNGINNIVIEFPDTNIVEDMVLRKVDFNTFLEAISLAKEAVKESQ